MSNPALALPDSPATNTRVQRLLSGDWTPYLQSSKEVVPFANTASGFGNPIAVIDEWDWGLLRHDIHVLYHKSVQGEK